MQLVNPDPSALAYTFLIVHMFAGMFWPQFCTTVRVYVTAIFV